MYKELTAKDLEDGDFIYICRYTKNGKGFEFAPIKLQCCKNGICNKDNESCNYREFQVIETQTGAKDV